MKSKDHSPIIGWAYDGNPIYGPYGYLYKSLEELFLQMKSGYKIDLKENRPPTSLFPEGFFVEDFTYQSLGRDDVLDKNNGRFCVTPDFPKGTYAYFATINDSSIDSSGPFAKYRRPSFPYLIGDGYASNPIEFNFLGTSNQNNFELNDGNWSRVINKYNLIEDDIKYDYIYIPNKLSQRSTIRSIESGSINQIGITSSGNNYQIGDSLIFDNSETSGNVVSAKVSEILGKDIDTINVDSKIIDNVEVYPSPLRGEYVLYSPDPHGLSDLDEISISGLSTTSVDLNEVHVANIKNNTLRVIGSGNGSTGILPVESTGFITYFEVSGNLSYPHIKENDILLLNSEKVKVLNIDEKLSRIRVLRCIDGTTGTSHPVSSELIEQSKKIFVNSRTTRLNNSKINKEIYFNPSESVALGTIGEGITLSPSNVFVPLKSIYIENHNLKTGDILTYSSNGGDPLTFVEEGDLSNIKSLSDQQNVFVSRVNDNTIGISTVRVGLNELGIFAGIDSQYKESRTLYFSGIGTGSYHSYCFSTNYESIKCKVSRNLVTVSTAPKHMDLQITIQYL